GAAVRANPYLRIRRRPEPFEALLAAITEQLIELERAAVIQKRIVAALVPRCPRSGMRVFPTAQAVAGMAPARLQSFDMSARGAPFAPYAPWAGLAGAYLLRAPRQAGTRWSASAAKRAA